ncbi:TPA: hypothetical protein DCX24_01220 [Candidatus Azambacteria bacterium]|nr:hypothetical protein [Rheinheimera sp.]HAW91524.1 hypothetical protein [Candidatus Azambacteria bacterium]|tara:strand:- start:741 stop:938 length:198 start_codon:yes stop_codon:yes gene_type:complete
MSQSKILTLNKERNFQPRAIINVSFRQSQCFTKLLQKVANEALDDGQLADKKNGWRTSRFYTVDN